MLPVLAYCSFLFLISITGTLKFTQFLLQLTSVYIKWCFHSWTKCVESKIVLGHPIMFSDQEKCIYNLKCKHFMSIYIWSPKLPTSQHDLKLEEAATFIILFHSHNSLDAWIQICFHLDKAWSIKAMYSFANSLCLWRTFRIEIQWKVFTQNCVPKGFSID